MMDFTKPVQSRDGRKVEIFKTDAVNTEYPVLGSMIYDSGKESISCWTAEGYFLEGAASHPSSLINVPEKHVRWGVLTDAWGFASKEEAETHRDAFHPHRSKCTIVRVEWEDGEGLEAIRYDENCDPWKVADEALKGGE